MKAAKADTPPPLDSPGYVLATDWRLENMTDAILKRLQREARKARRERLNAIVGEKVLPPGMSWFETEKRKRNLAAGYEETKGLENGHCNRAACQEPLLPGDPRGWMRDHETNTDAKLYYCLGCVLLFNETDRQMGRPFRCTVEG
jgi:hypothetical protein